MRGRLRTKPKELPILRSQGKEKEPPFGRELKKEEPLQKSSEEFRDA